MPRIVIYKPLQSQRHEEGGNLDRKHYHKGEIARVRTAENEHRRRAELRYRVESVQIYFTRFRYNRAVGRHVSHRRALPILPGHTICRDMERHDDAKSRDEMRVVREEVAIGEQRIIRTTGEDNIMELQLTPDDLVFIVAFGADREQEGGQGEQ